MAIHKDLTGEKAIHQAAYVQSSDPGAVGALKTWYDTTTDPAVHKVRNADDDGWLLVGTASTGLADHLADTSDAHDASAISYAGGTGMSATNVEAAVDELATEKADVSALDAKADLVEGVLYVNQIPPRAKVTVFEVDSEVEQLDLNIGVDEGDIAYRTDTGDAYVHNSGVTETMADWTLLSGEGGDTGLADHLADTSDAHDASAISYAGGTGMSATDVEAAIDELATEKANVSDLTAHTGDTSDAHDASAVSFVPAGTIAATDVQAAIEEVASEASAGGTGLSDHLADTTDAHDASAISFVPAGSISSSNVQAALEEVDGALAAGGYRTLIELGSDVSNSTSTYADITGLSFAVTSGSSYRFEAFIVFDSQATTTGAKFAVNGPASPTTLVYIVEWTSNTGSGSTVPSQAYDGPAAASSSGYTTGNFARIRGLIKPSASGTFALRFGSEAPGTNNQITAKAGSTLEYW